MTWHVYTDGAIDRRKAALRIERFDPNTDTIYEVKPFDFQTRKLGFAAPPDWQPAIVGPEAIAFMQAVMDAAYEFGLRPSRNQDDCHLKAHLEDMRRIVFGSAISRTPPDEGEVMLMPDKNVFAQI